VAVKYPSIPDAPLGSPNKESIDAMKETLEILKGERRDTARKENQAVTFKDLLDLGLISETDIPK
jgi:hypothetical protein